MSSRAVPAMVLAFLAQSAFSALPTKTPPAVQPTEVKIISVPPAQPTEVKIVSTPPASPAEVKILSAPPNESERAMVRLTLWILVANAALCIVTFVIGVKQGGDNRKSIAVSAQAAAAAGISADAANRSADAARDSVDVTKQQERAQMVREVNRAAHKVRVTATRLEQLASEVPTTRNQLHTLLHQGGMPPTIKEETDKTLQSRRTALERMASTASVNAVQFTDLHALSDKELAERLWGLDEQQVRLEAMQDSITYELNKYETEIHVIRQQKTAMQAAALNATMSTPLKTKLGE